MLKLPNNIKSTERVIKVSIKKQKLTLYNGNKKCAEFTVSTAKNGAGSLKNSLKTPLGVHKIFRKTGKGRGFGTIFKDRIQTGEIWDGKSLAGDLITTRILQLEGLEPKKNRGGDVDTKARFIYIHGTNHENNIGTPTSHGCILMKNSEIIELFEIVKKGDLVVIT